MQTLGKGQKPNSIVLTTLILAGFFMLIYPYIKTEINMISVKKDYDFAPLCKEVKNSGLQTFKVVEYSKLKKTATVYCIYDEGDYDLELQLSKNSENMWKKDYVEKIDKDGLYWPTYP